MVALKLDIFSSLLSFLAIYILTQLGHKERVLSTSPVLSLQHDEVNCTCNSIKSTEHTLQSPSHHPWTQWKSCRLHNHLRRQKFGQFAHNRNNQSIMPNGFDFKAYQEPCQIHHHQHPPHSRCLRFFLAFSTVYLLLAS